MLGSNRQLRLQGIEVHPNVFHAALEPLPVSAWQVIDEGGRLRVLVAGERDAFEAATAKRAVEAALLGAGVADVLVEAETVGSIPKTRLGKSPLVRRAASAAPPIH